MNLDDIARVSMAVELEGQAYFVYLPLESFRVLLSMSQGLSENGQLNLVKAPANYKFEAIGGLNDTAPIQKD